MIKHLSIAIVILFSSCISQKKQQESLSDISNNIIEILIETETNSLIFKVVNKSDKEIITLNQNKLYIEKRIDNDWEKVRLLSCPCGAPCAQNTEQNQILVGKYYTLKWDKKESWCGKKNKNGIPDTNTSFCQPGAYRIRIVYSSSQNKSQVIYKEFNIN